MLYLEHHAAGVYMAKLLILSVLLPVVQLLAVLFLGDRIMDRIWLSYLPLIGLLLVLVYALFPLSYFFTRFSSMDLISDGKRQAWQARPSFLDYHRGLWARKTVDAFYKYVDPASIVLCRDGRVYREKFYRLHNIIRFVLFPAGFLAFVPVLSVGVRAYLAGDLAAHVQNGDVYDALLASSIIIFAWSVLNFIVYPLISYFLNRFREIRQDDPACRQDFFEYNYLQGLDQ